MTDGKKNYYVQLPDKKRGELWDEEKYKRNETELYSTFPDVIVTELSPLASDAPVDASEKFSIQVPGYSRGEIWDADKLTRNREELMQTYPDVQISRVKSVDYWGDRLRETDGAIAPLEARLGEIEEELSSPDIRIGGFRRHEAVKLADEKKDINRQLETLYADRENNHLYKKRREARAKMFEEEDVRLNEMQKQLAEDNPEAATAYRFALMGGPSAAFGASHSDKEYNRDIESLAAARKYIIDAKQALLAPSKYDGSNGFANFFRGLLGAAPESISVVNLVNAGLNLHLVDAVKKIQETDGKDANIYELVDSPDKLTYLSAAEKELVKAFCIKSAVDMERSGDMSIAYQAGASAMQSLGFMADFMLFGGRGSAAGKAAAIATKPLVNAVAKASVKAGLKGGTRKAALAVPKFTLGTIEAATKTLVMTPMMPSSWASFTEGLLTVNDAGQVDLSGEAILRTLGDVFIENLSENAGAQVEGMIDAPFRLLGKGADKLFKGTPFSDWGRILRNSPASKFLRNAAWHGYVGEIGEEWYGNALRVMTGVDKDALKNFATVDQQLITLISFAPMSVFGTGMSGAQYVSARRQMEKKAEALTTVLENAGYGEQQIRDILDVTKAENPTELAHALSPVITQIAEDNGDGSAAYRAVADYAQAVARYRVFDGIHDADVSAQRLSMARELAQRAGTENIVQVHYAEDGATYDTMRTLTDNNGNVRYVVGRSDDGILALVDADGRGHSFISETDLEENVKDGLIQDSGEIRKDDFLDMKLAERKSSGETERMESERQRQSSDILSSLNVGDQLNVGTEENPSYGTVVGKTADGTVIVQTDGGVRQYTAEQVGDLIGKPVSVKSDDELEGDEADAADAVNDAMERFRSRNADAESHGLNIITETGDPVTVVRLHRSADTGTVTATLQDGSTRDFPAESVLKALDDEQAAMAHTDGRTETGETAAGQPEKEETPAEENAQTKDFRGNPLPLDANGEVDQTTLWNSDPEAWAKWNDGRRGDNGASSIEYLNAAAAKLRSDIKKTDKARAKELDFKKKDAMEAQVSRLSERLAKLEEIMSGYAAKRSEEAAAKMRAEMEQAKAARTAKAEELRKYNIESLGGIRKKWEDAPKVIGTDDSIILPSGEEIGGSYVLTEAYGVTPSHDPENGYAKTEGFPVDENGRTVNDRDYEKDKEAQRQVESKAAAYDQRALQTPVVVSSDGVVLSGNDRTMASQLAARQGSDGKYNDYLSAHAQKFGFTAEQVAQFRNPRVVFVPAESMPYTASTFAKFNAEEKKTQSKTESAVKAGKTVSPEALQAIAEIIDGHESVAETYADADAVAAIVRTLVDAGVVQENEVSRLMDGDHLSGTGEDLVESVLLGAVMREDALRCAMEDRAIRRSVMSALNQLLKNSTYGDYSLIGEFSDAVVLLYSAKRSGLVKGGESVANYMNQPVLEGFGENPLAEVTVQLIANTVNGAKVNGLKNLLSLYNPKAEMAATGQADLFLGGVQSKESIVREILEEYGYNTETYTYATGGQRQSAAGQSERQESGGSEEQASDALSGVAADGAAGEATREIAPESDYKLSDEVDENGRQFVLNSEGGIRFGEITSETGLTPAPILLSEGAITNPSTNAGYGLVHIEARHGEQIRKAGYKSVVDFVETIARNYEIIRKGAVRRGIQTYMLLLTDKHNNTLMVELSGDSSYWNINTAGIFKESYGVNRREVYNRHTTANQTAESDGESQNAPQSSTETSSRMNSPTSSSSDGKDIKESLSNKEITPEQSSLLNQPDSGQYSTEQELSSGNKDIQSSGTKQENKEGTDGRPSIPGSLIDEARRIAEERKAAQEAQRKAAEEKNEGQFGLVSDARMEELKKRLLDKLKGQLNSGFDPETLSIGMELAAGYIDRGIKRFADFSKAMIADIGDAVRPYLKAFYNGARDMPGMETLSREMDSYDAVSAADVKTIGVAQEERPPYDDAQSAEKTLGTVNADKDTRDNSDIWLVKPAERVSADDFKKLKERARDNGGYWSSFKKGFLFKSEQEAHAFNNIEHNGRTGEDTKSGTAGSVQVNDETRTHTAAAVREAGLAAGESRAMAEDEGGTGIGELAESARKIDEALDRANGELALLGYYSADGKDWHESYRQMRNAERRAVKDAEKLAEKIAFDLGAEVSGKAEASLAPVGDGDIRFRIRLADGTDLCVNVGLSTRSKEDSARYLESNPDDLKVADIRYWVEDSSKDGAGRHITHPYYFAPNVEYGDMLDSFRVKFRDHLPEQPTGRSILRDAEIMAEKASRKKSEKKDRKSEEKSAYLQNGDDLLGDLFSSLNESESDEDAAQAEPVEVQSTTTDSNGLQGVYGVRAEGMRTDDSRHESGLAEKSGETGERAGQDGGRADGQGVGRSIEENRDSSSRLGHSVEDTTESDSVDVPEQKSRKKNNIRNNNVGRGAEYAPKTPSERIKANIEAIRLMKALTEEERPASKKDMEVLRQYTGWGGLGSLFNNQYSSREYRELESLLTPEEMQSAEYSINTAYFTPAGIIDTLWDLAKRLGFKGGKILEGSAGIGNMLASMPKNISEASEISAVELDPVTGNMLRLLYPDADVQIKGFQDADIDNNSIDLAITNVPFGTGISVYDSKEKDLTRKFGNRIHDFCIAKNVRKLREGGIGIFITTSGTLDKSRELRNWIVDEGNSDFIGAFRLNNETFGGTPVTSDIIVIRKRVNGQKSPEAIDVSGTTITRRAQIKGEEEWNPRTRSYEDKVKDAVMEYNSYFVGHPENMAGEMMFGAEKGDTFRPGSVGLYRDAKKPQEKLLAKWVKDFRETEMNVAEGSGTKTAVSENADGVKEGQLILNSKGEICLSQKGKAVPVGVNANKVKGYEKRQVVRDYDTIKTALANVLDYQEKNEDDAGLKPLLDGLNRAYDDFVSKYGNLNKNIAIAFLRNDVDFPSVAAVEEYKESVAADGRKIVSISKTDVFSKRVVGFQTEPHPKNVMDGIIVSMNRSGKIDIPYIADETGLSEEQVRNEVLESGLGFVNPATGAIEDRDEYLSGNVREKLDYAREHNRDGEFDGNIRALEKVIPADIPAHLIDFNLGSDWIDGKLYTEYAQEKFGLNENFKPQNIGGVWSQSQYTYIESTNEKNRAAGVISEVVGDMVLGHELMLAAMNNVQIRFSKTVKHRDGSTETVTDKNASEAAAGKIEDMRQDFKEWAKDKVLKDETLAKDIAETYNRLFNAIVPKEIGDEFLPERFIGATTLRTLYPHQKKAVIKGTTQPVLLAHEVGTGKSYTLISTAMELRRLSLAKKPMIVVQNATVGQFVGDAKFLYPNSKILTVSEADRTQAGRAAFYAKIKYNDWDMIVVPQSVFEMIPDSEERQRAFIQEKIDEKMHIIELAKKAGMDGRSVSSMERELKSLQREYETGEPEAGGKKRDAKREAKTKENAAARAKQQLDRKTDEVSNFDEMGIDALLIDEAHAYKHLGFSTQMQRGVKGVDPSYSKRSAGVYLKLQSIFDRVGRRNVVFATGTPISNTAAEIWTFMKYLMSPDVMKANHIYYFDDFVRNFGNIAQTTEFTTSGKYKETTRFSGYVNLPELVRTWSLVADTVLSKDAKDAQGKDFKEKLPELEGGKAQDIFLPQSPSLIGIMNYVRAKLDEFDKMSGAEKKNNGSIPLVMYGIAQRAAIDPRLVDRNAADEPLSKTNRAVEEILKDLKDTESYKGTCAVFCDNYRRLDAAADGKDKVEGFNLFKEMKRKLVESGVPEEQIAIMESGMTADKKQKIFDRVIDGDIRVIMGTTQTLGTGVNIQTRLHSVIHMDAPNRPMDYTQRNGRILRQGNLHKEWGKTVRVIRFGVEDSLDVTAYQRLKTKSEFIDAVMNGKPLLRNAMEGRTIEEPDEGLYDNAVAQLSGSQYAIKVSAAEREIRKLKAQKLQHAQDQIHIESQLKQNNSKIGSFRKHIDENREAVSVIESTFKGGKVSKIGFNGKTYSNEESLNEALKKGVSSEIKEYLDNNRNNRAFSKGALTYRLSFDGIDTTVNVTVTRKEEYTPKTGFFGKMSTVMEYDCPRLGVEHRKVEGNAIKEMVADFRNNVVTGKYSNDVIARLETAIERMERDNALMLERRGKPFKDEHKLKEAADKLAEYQKLMKAEMDEKEAKYAQSQAAEVHSENIGTEIDKLMESDGNSSSDAEFEIESEESDREQEETDEQRLAYDAVSQMLSDAGIPVEEVSGEAMRQMAEDSEKKGEALETVSSQNGYQQTVISSASGAKVLKNLDSLHDSLVNAEKTEAKTFLGRLAEALGAVKHGSNSQYASFVTKNEKSITIRLANHNANISTFDNHEESDGISIVISAKKNNGVKNDGKAHLVEFYYDVIKLRRAEGKPLADIVASVEQALYSGEYKDTTGLAQVEEVNAENIPEFMTVYHGSGAKFDKFDSAYMGTGEGAQAYGWGHYVTEVEGIGRTYADASTMTNGGSSLFELTIANIKTRMRAGSSFEDARKTIVERLENIFARHTGEAEYASTRETIERLKNLSESDIPQSVLYTIDIPEDTGHNYLEWAKVYRGEELYALLDRIGDVLKTRGYDLEKEYNHEASWNTWLERLRMTGEDWEPDAATGEDIYHKISTMAGENPYSGNPELASDILHSVGFVGITMPAQYRSGGREDGAKNYVIFKDSDLKITSRIEFLRDGDVVYGAAVGGKIYLNADRLNPNTPVHEYTHLWDKACKAKNPELWKRGVELMKQTPLWKEVENDPNYSGLDEEGIASEVHSRLTGEHGAELLERMSREALEGNGGAIDKAARVSVISKLRRWLSDFWYWVKDTMTSWSRSEAAKVSLEDFVNMPIADLAKGTRLDTDFNVSENNDIRFSIVTDEKEIERLNSEPTIKVYRAMQLRDGKLYPPMAGKVNGKWQQGIAVEDLGKVWEKADEHPELADEKGRFTLNKGNGTSLKARYNPYIHTSTTPLNDQFSSAQSRPELVTVEVEIPESELTSGYKAEKAKDGVGKVEWKAGAVQGQLTGTREVILSRWDKPVRIVPESEVADRIVEMFDGKDITMPSNVVTPALREELEKRGVPFVETDNQGRPVEQSEDIEKVNAKFNEQLGTLTEENADRVILSLGTPSDILLSAGVEDKPMKLYGNKVMQKMRKHGFALEELRDLPSAVANPIAVFNNYGKDGNRSILTELRTANGNFLVAVNLGKGMDDIDFNIVSSVFGKGEDNIADWLSRGLATYIDKEKALNYLHHSALRAVTSDNPRLSSATKVVESFENPSISGENEQDIYLEREGERSYNSVPTSLSRSQSGKRYASEEMSRVVGVPVEYLSRDEMPENHRNAKGYWKNGKIYVCLENHPDADDVRRTVLHEAVGHNGLRRLVGDGNMDAFCMEVFAKLPKSERAVITEAALRKYRGDFAEATEEYLARKAETTDTEKSYDTLWDTILVGLRNLLAKIGINLPLTERDVKWILWQSFNANRRNSLLNEAQRQVLAERLGFSNRITEMRAKADEAIRLRDDSRDSVDSAADFYNIAVQNWKTRLHEGWVDMYNSVNTLVEAIEKQTGKLAQGFEDIRLALNQQSSKELAEIKAWERDFYNPMMQAVRDIMDGQGLKREDVDRYAFLKHGLERNDVFAKRDARDYYMSRYRKKIDDIKTDGELSDAEKARKTAVLEKERDAHLADIDAGTDGRYLKNRERDYGGLTAMFSAFDDIEPKKVGESEERYRARVLAARHPMYDNLSDIEDAARKEVADFERKAGKASIDRLWNAANRATKSVLTHQREANMVTREQYESVRDMFSFYVPMRGFADNTAEDMYSYYGGADSGGSITPPLIKAKGRNTQAESPWGYIGAMASTAIAADSKNNTKLALYYFVANRPENDLVMVSDVWYEKDGIDPVTGKQAYKAVYPAFNEALDSDAARDAYARWEKDMEDKMDRGEAVKGTKRINLQHSVIHIDTRHEMAHVIKFRLNGVDKMMLINGNPRAAQAINNELNIDASKDAITRAAQSFLRFMSGMNTSYNPAFWLSNAQRDLLFSLSAVSIKEDSDYARRFASNLGRAVKVIRMLKRDRKGTLGSSHLENMYREFVANGGVTGFTVIKDNEEWEKMGRRFTADRDKAGQTVMKALEAVQEVGEGIEQMTRFAAYLTSRESGKTVAQSVSDAKELTVNFNRKGSGQGVGWKESAMLSDSEGRPLNAAARAFVVGASALAGYGRRMIMFFNASVQGLNTLYRLWEKDRRRTAAWMTGYFVLGAINAILHAMMDDDDDYLDMPDYERRNNFLLGGKGSYIKWALPQESRVFYAFGDVLVNDIILGRNPQKKTRGAADVLESVGDILPLNPMNGARGLVPEALVPVFENMQNEDYKGAKIYNRPMWIDDEESERTPHYKEAYSSTGRLYTLVSMGLNSLTGGDAYTAGLINLRPEKMEHIVEGYTGGLGTFLNQIWKSTGELAISSASDASTGDTSFGEALKDNFAVRNTPFLNRLFVMNDERYRNSHTSEVFNYYKAEAEHFKKIRKAARKSGDADTLFELYDNDEQMNIYSIYSGYKGVMKAYDRMIRDASTRGERRQLMREQDEYRKEMIQDIAEANK